ncbi:Transmembrane protease serine 9, partial [Trichinella nativa]
LLNFNANVESDIQCGRSMHENASPVRRWMLNSTISLPKFNPWNVFISGKNKTCGGVLVQIYPDTTSSEIVLTSGQCFIDKEGHLLNYADYKVYLGGHSFNENQKTTTISVGIKQITVMEFDKQTMQNDLAMVVLETTVPFDYNIRAICLPHYSFDIKYADWISLTGWKTHTRKNQGPRSSGILQNIPIITLSEEECEEIIPIFHRYYHTCGIRSTEYFYKHRTVFFKSIFADIECGISHYVPTQYYTSVGYPPHYTNARASPYSMPWSVIIETEDKVCGGVLIRLEKIANRSHTVLTSSYCFSQKFGKMHNYANTKVHFGVHRFPPDTDKVTVGIKQVTSTPYEVGMIKKDIALITLQSEVEFNEKIRPICLPSINYKPSTAQKYPLVGWVLSKLTRFKKIPYLLQVPIILLEPSECAMMLEIFSDDDHICGYFYDPHMFNNSVPLDLGSALISTYQKNLFIIGLFSAMIRFENMTGHVLLFSRISTSVEWIVRSNDPSSPVDYLQFLPSNVPCGKATAKRLEAEARVGSPPNFKNVMAVPKSMPWNVIVQADVSTCGGVLIRLNDEFNYTDTVLTSSRCFYKNFKVDHANVKVYLGAHKLPISRGTLTVGVKQVTTTPLAKNEYQKDLAVITLEGNVEFSEKIRPICLPDKDVEFTTPAVLWLVGWNTIDGDGFPSLKVPFLMQIPVYVLKPSTCKKIFDHYSTHDHICGRYVDPYLFNITQNVDYGSPLIGSDEDTLYVLGTFNGHVGFPNNTGNDRCGVEKFPQRKLYYFMPNETNVEENIEDYVHAFPHSFPWSVIIKSKNRTCGGALVGMPHSYLYGEHVLTTAQCFLDQNDKYINHDNYEVVLGAHILSRRRGQMVVGIKQVTLSAFDRSTMGPDFALITLETAVHFNDRIQPICLPVGDVLIPESSILPLVGWNLSPDSNSMWKSAVLQQIAILPHSHDECEEIFQNYSPSKHICGSVFDPTIKALKLSVDIGSILSAEIANQSFLYGLFSGQLSSSSAENDIFLFNRIQYSTEWLLRSADPAFNTFNDIQHLSARPHSYPWSVALVSKTRTCGGVLIMLSTNVHASELVITSAQCFINSTGHRIDHAQYEVVLGAHNMKSKHSALILGIKYVTIAELEDYRMFRDLAIVTLQTQVLYSKTIQPVCIPEPDIPMDTGDVLPLLGWNLIDIRVLPKELCEEVIPAFNTEHHVCGRFADRYLYKAKVTVDIGSALVLSSAGRVFLYALFSGHYTRNFTNDLLLFYKIETSIEWMARSANPMINEDSIVILSVNPLDRNA